MCNRGMCSLLNWGHPFTTYTRTGQKGSEKNELKLRAD